MATEKAGGLSRNAADRGRVPGIETGLMMAPYNTSEDHPMITITITEANAADTETSTATVTDTRPEGSTPRLTRVCTLVGQDPICPMTGTRTCAGADSKNCPAC
jgi:hypothetical protein